MEAVTPTPLQWNVPQVWAHASRSEEERDERAERRRISGIQRKYEARERDERAERRRSCKRLHQKGEGEEGKRGRLISIQRHRAR